MKLMWKEHKRTCRKKKADTVTAIASVTTTATATDALVGHLAGLKVGQRRFWLEVRAPEHKLIAEYLDVAGLCRVDSAMTGVEERKEWQKAIKGLHSVALNKWPRYSNLDRFAGLRWCMRRRIELRGIKIERIVMPGYGEVPRKDHFGALCELGYKDIAKLMVVSKSIGLNSKGHEGRTPTLHAAYYGYIEVLHALIQAGADFNQAADDGFTPLYMACQQGHVEVVHALIEAGAALNQAMDRGCTPIFPRFLPYRDM